MFAMKKVVVHPLVLLSVVDHFNRVAKVGVCKRVVGVLLGSWRKNVLDVSNSFALPFDEEEQEESVWFLDHGYLENMFGMFKKVNAKEKMVGWYHTGPKVHKNDIAINDLIKQYCPNAVLVVVDVNPEDFSLPIRAYVSVEEIHDNGNPTTKTFEHMRCIIGAEEAEEVGVEHLLRNIRDRSVGTVSRSIAGKALGLQELHSRIVYMMSYLEKVVTGTLPFNERVVYRLQDIFSFLPDIKQREFVKALYVKTNDQMLVVYLASLIRSVLALHNLINNKIANRNAEAEEKEREDGNAASKKENKPTTAAIGTKT
ncbi:26S proteasome non-ATPase regulatory subunit 7-like [Arapaima gigas]